MDGSQSTKPCRDCGNEWPLTSFYWHSQSRPVGSFRPNCRACRVHSDRREITMLELHAGEGYKICNICLEPKLRTGEFFAIVGAGRLHPYCKPCSNEYAGRRRDPVKNAAMAAEWRKKNPERSRESKRKSYVENRDKHLADKKVYYERNREEIREKARAYRQENPEKIKARLKAYQLANLDRFRISGHKRRAMERGAEGSYTLADVRRIYEEQEGLCYYCCSELGGVFEMDHMMPLSRGGSNWPDNLAASCRSCNASKNNKTVEEFLGGVALT